jgi:hypothetical protein
MIKVQERLSSMLNFAPVKKKKKSKAIPETGRGGL